MASLDHSMLIDWPKCSATKTGSTTILIAIWYTHIRLGGVNTQVDDSSTANDYQFVKTKVNCRTEIDFGCKTAGQTTSGPFF